MSPLFKSCVYGRRVLAAMVLVVVIFHFISVTVFRDNTFASPHARPPVCSEGRRGGEDRSGNHEVGAHEQVYAAHRLAHGLPEDADTIFASVASFRDVECAPTISDMFGTARNPRWLFVGAVEQHAAEDGTCLPEEYRSCPAGALFCPSDNIRIRRVDPRRSAGPTFGRYVAALLYRGERWLLMIDSHNRFAVSWDATLLAMHRQIGSPKAVISHYPSSINKTSKMFEPSSKVRLMCCGRYMRRTGYLQMCIAFRPVGTIRRQPFTAAGFLFTTASLLRDVPFDPHLDFLFHGEELLLSARMWTAGYDLYSPNVSVLAHFYLRANKHGTENRSRYHHQTTSIHRVQHILRITKNHEPDVPLVTAKMIRKSPRIAVEIEKYGLGNERSLEEYWRFAEVTPSERGPHENKLETNFCRHHKE